MFGSLGVGEIIFILGLALLIFGPRKLPEIGKQIGRGLGEFRRASNELKRQLNTELALDDPPVYSPPPPRPRPLPPPVAPASAEAAAEAAACQPPASEADVVSAEVADMPSAERASPAAEVGRPA
jgi:sec-independent protein translocase protein TatB